MKFVKASCPECSKPIVLSLSQLEMPVNCEHCHKVITVKRPRKSRVNPISQKLMTEDNSAFLDALDSLNDPPDQRDEDTFVALIQSREFRNTEPLKSKLPRSLRTQHVAMIVIFGGILITFCIGVIISRNSESDRQTQLAEQQRNTMLADIRELIEKGELQWRDSDAKGAQSTFAQANQYLNDLQIQFPNLTEPDVDTILYLQRRVMSQSDHIAKYLLAEQTKSELAEQAEITRRLDEEARFAIDILKRQQQVTEAEAKAQLDEINRIDRLVESYAAEGDFSQAQKANSELLAYLSSQTARPQNWGERVLNANKRSVNFAANLKNEDLLKDAISWKHNRLQEIDKILNIRIKDVQEWCNNNNIYSKSQISVRWQRVLETKNQFKVEKEEIENADNSTLLTLHGQSIKKAIARQEREAAMERERQQVAAEESQKVANFNWRLAKFNELYPNYTPQLCRCVQSQASALAPVYGRGVTKVDAKLISPQDGCSSCEGLGFVPALR